MEQQKVNIKVSERLKHYLEDILFVELKEDKPFWPKALPMPVYLKTMVHQIKQDEIDSISTEAIIRGVVTMLGADPKFVHNAAYIDLLSGLDENIWLHVLGDGLKHAEERAYQDAILYFNAVLVANFENVDALFNMGRAFDDIYQENEDKKLLPFIKHCYERTAELAPEYGPAYYALGFFYYNEERFTDAEDQWLKALSCDLSYEMREDIVTALGKVKDRAIFERGKAYVLAGRLEEGLELLYAIEENHDDWWQLNFFIGLALRFQTTYEDALPYFLKVLSLNTGYVQAMNEAGICLIAMGDYEQALNYYKEALRLSPKNPEYLCNKGVVYYHMKQYDDAYIAIEEAYTLMPEDEVIEMWYRHIQKLDDERHQMMS